MLEKTSLNNSRVSKLISFCVAREILIDKIVYDNNLYEVFIKSFKLFPELFEMSDGVLIDFRENDLIKAFIENN